MLLNRSWLAAFVLVFSSIPAAIAPKAAAAAELYLFSARRYSTGTSQDGNLSTSLYRFASGRLLPIPLAKAPPEFAGYVIDDSELRLLVVGGSHLMPSELQFISMDKPDALRSIEVNFPGLSTGHAHLTDFRGPGSVLLLTLYDDRPNGTRVMKALDTSSGQWTAFSPEAYHQIRITGGTAGYGFGGDQESLTRLEEGKLTVTFDPRDLPLGPPLPAGLRYSTNEWPELYLNNSEMAVVANPRTARSDRQIVYRVLDKRRNEWIRLVVPGDKSFNIRAFGTWMAGIIAESQDQNPKTFRVSPSRKMPGTRGLFRTIDEYLYVPDKPFYSLYRPGTLFLYNVQTRRYYEWDTHDGDCEVLLVEDGQVYYRVDQAIYRAKIGEKELGNPELLVEDKEVPGIHWAFFGPAVPLPAKPPAARE